jgi:hypothetical protein
VKAWCEAHADHLDDVLDPDLGDRIDLLLIAVDVDIALEAKIADPPTEVGVYESKRLRETLTEWLCTEKRKNLPAAVVVSTPVMAIEAWIIAALFPRERAPEQIDDPAAWLVKKSKLRLSDLDGKPWKELHRYQAFAPAVAKNLRRVRQACTEAERTLHLVDERRERLRKR